MVTAIACSLVALGVVLCIIGALVHLHVKLGEVQKIAKPAKIKGILERLNNMDDRVAEMETQLEIAVEAELQTLAENIWTIRGYLAWLVASPEVSEDIPPESQYGLAETTRHHNEQWRQFCAKVGTLRPGAQPREEYHIRTRNFLYCEPPTIVPKKAG